MKTHRKQIEQKTLKSRETPKNTVEKSSTNKGNDNKISTKTFKTDKYDP